MAQYIFTRKGYEALLALMHRTEEMLGKAIKLKSDSGSGQDGWHDEGFKIGAVEETMWSRRLGELEDLCRNARVIDPKEQNEIVDLGTGVIIEYENGSISEFILEGFAIETLDNRLSIHSPLGDAILGAKKGEKRVFQVGNNKKTVTIKEILPPSVSESVLKKIQ